jgi:rubrerythrin
MRELTVTEIIEYAENVETESFRFYSEARERIKDSEVKELLSILADDETMHFNNLKKLREEGTLSANEMQQKLQIESEVLDIIVNSDVIVDDADWRDVLEIALQREIRTEKLYTMMLSFSQLNSEVYSLFATLRMQEKGHIAKIQEKLNK